MFEFSAMEIDAEGDGSQIEGQQAATTATPMFDRKDQKDVKTPAVARAAAVRPTGGAQASVRRVAKPVKRIAIPYDQNAREGRDPDSSDDEGDDGMSALLIKSKWLKKIERGEKWVEFRTQRTRLRQIAFCALSKKTNERFITSIGRIVSVTKCEDALEFFNLEGHCLTNEEFELFMDKSLYAWEIKDVMILPHPVPIERNGGRVWQRLDDDTIQAIREQLPNTGPPAKAVIVVE